MKIFLIILVIFAFGALVNSGIESRLRDIAENLSFIGNQINSIRAIYERRSDKNDRIK